MLYIPSIYAESVLYIHSRVQRDITILVKLTYTIIGHQTKQIQIFVTITVQSHSISDHCYDQPEIN